MRIAHLKSYFASKASPLQAGWPQSQIASTDPLILSQWALQNFCPSGGTQLQAGLAHFVSLMTSPVAYAIDGIREVGCGSGMAGNQAQQYFVRITMETFLGWLFSGAWELVSRKARNLASGENQPDAVDAVVSRAQLATQ
jgi:hypothetical protein